MRYDIQGYALRSTNIISLTTRGLVSIIVFSSFEVQTSQRGSQLWNGRGRGLCLIPVAVEEQEEEGVDGSSLSRHRLCIGQVLVPLSSFFCSPDNAAIASGPRLRCGKDDDCTAKSQSLA